MISRSGMPIGTSTRPVRLILPTSEKILVPFDLPVPMASNQAAPFLTILGIVARVSTLLMQVGNPQSPLSTGNGGFGFGSPIWSSSEAISAVSSPQTKAPAPSLT